LNLGFLLVQELAKEGDYERNEDKKTCAKNENNPSDVFTLMEELTAGR
jgi:hypothetical protein